MYVSQNGRGGPAPDLVQAAGALGQYFLGKYSGLGDYFAALNIAGPTLARRMRAGQGLGNAQVAVLYKRVQAQRAAAGGQTAIVAPKPKLSVFEAARRLTQQQPVMRQRTEPAVNVSSAAPSVPASNTAAPAPGPSSYDWGYDTTQYKAPVAFSTASSNGENIPVEVGTLPVQTAGMFGNINPMLLLAGAAAWFLFGQKRR